MTEYLHIGRASDLARPTDRRLYRFLEMIPGLLAWGTLALVLVGSYYAPGYAALFIILFDIYWLVKTIYLSFHLRYGYVQARRNMKINWLEKIKTNDIYHLIILPTLREDTAVIRDSLLGLARANYPKDRMIVALAQEERAGIEHNNFIKKTLELEFGDTFFYFTSVQHPDGIVGELAGKGANIAWAAKQAIKDGIDNNNISHDRVMVSVFDIDTVVYPEYFGILTHAFLTEPNPLRASYQPIPFFFNNIWDAPALARVVAFSSTFWQMIQQARPENLITFSSHSMPLQAVVDIGFWQTNMVSEDSRVFWQCLLRYNGDYRVVPLYYPVSLDANLAPKFWRTLVSVYRQHRRWGYGAENVPYYLFGFIKNKKIALSKKLFYAITVGEGYWSWATNAIILFVLGWLPGLIGGTHFNSLALSFNQTQFSNIVMRLAMLALLTPLIMSVLILPPRPAHVRRWNYIWMVLQWILFPITTIVFGAFPGLEAQTRLMLGKYMSFWVTPKYRRATRNVQSVEVR